ncbi:MAG: methionyl-tRNA formyltransferase [Clostridia bacterium]|nr:methionyl-tRNA formyltransferase [Clostridia bacterium]
MRRSDLRIAFLGTPEFALPSLSMLFEEDFGLIQVITQPDRPAGRGHRLSPPPVKTWALEHGVPVWQPEKLRSEENTSRLRALGCNLMITAAYGQILSQEILDIPALGCINVHASLLPAYRGASPVVWSLINGEETAGVSTMRTVEALDAGPVLEQDSVSVGPDMTGGELMSRLSQLGAKTLERTLVKLLEGTLSDHPQAEAEASYYPVLPKGFGEIDWNHSTREVLNFIRALAPSPGAYIVLPEGERIRVFAASRREGQGKPGEIVFRDPKQGLVIAARDGLVSLDEIKRPGSRRMRAADSLRGRGIGADRVREARV